MTTHMWTVLGTTTFWLGLTVGFLAGMAWAICRRAWKDRRTATILAKAARRNAWLSIPPVGAWFGGIAFVTVLLIWTLATHPPTRAGGVTGTPSPSVSPAR